jgi:succinate dehydrogenase / fumarate reductase iron-sulfur subunit
VTKAEKTKADPRRGAPRTVRLRVLRQDSAKEPGTRRWEEFRVAVGDATTVTDALMDVERHPVTTDGRETVPVAWETGCLEGICGACTVLVNGVPRPACTTRLALLPTKPGFVTVAPLEKFPLVRDLVVDRSRMARDLGLVRAFLEPEERAGSEPASRGGGREMALASALGRCTSCAACLEACPEYGTTEFVGAAVLGEVLRRNAQGGGAPFEARRLEAVMTARGIAGCGKAENCVEVCPAGIPLADALQTLARKATRHLLTEWLFG